MDYGWHARLFGLLDFIWWSCIAFTGTCLCISFIKTVVGHSMDGSDVVLIIACGIMLCFCYLSLASTIGLIKATSENESGPTSRIKLCLFWLILSIISYAISISCFLYMSHYKLTAEFLIFFTQFIGRSFAIYCVYQYMQQLKTEIRMSIISNVMIPLTSTDIFGTNSTITRPITLMERKKRINRVESLPNYEELMVQEKEMQTSEESPPKYDSIIYARC